MNTDTISAAFIKAIKDKIPATIIDSLDEALPISKEAIYRRLRGEVPFSYPEAVQLAQKLGISLDETNSFVTNSFSFKISSDADLSADKAYSEVLTFGSDLFPNEKKESFSDFCFTSLGIPFCFTANYQQLSKFRYYKWLHENRRTEINKKFSEIDVSSYINDISTNFLSIIRQTDSTFIVSDAMCEMYVKEVNHFVSLGLIDSAEVALIKEDLHSLINEFEETVAFGKYKDGGKVSFFLSEANFGTAFGYIVDGEEAIAFNQIFAMNYTISSDPHIFQMYEAAFENIKDYGSMLSQSASAKRIAFFNEQRRIIDVCL